ncbi:MAG: hypothetical protein NZM25_06855 [Leptospiraceae bacterium]|nr:hypothetical protein [Leptospiraceae bacterium]MDW8306846.1 hypothetical protein [Leptospiraceae bacterium]
MGPPKGIVTRNALTISIIIFFSYTNNLVASQNGYFFSLGTLRSSLVAAPNEVTYLVPLSISARYFSGNKIFQFIGFDAAIARNRSLENEYYTRYRDAGYLGASFGQGYWLFGSDEGARAAVYLSIKPYFYFERFSFGTKYPQVVPPDAVLDWQFTLTYMGGFQFAFNKNLSVFLEGGYGGLPHAALGLTYWVYRSEQ